MIIYFIKMIIVLYFNFILMSLMPASFGKILLILSIISYDFVLIYVKDVVVYF